jgi:AcrR family transcriptional regulator
VSTRAGGKRDRLVEAARDLFHRRGVEGTTLAHIAKAADVPLGNVYYYFKTKDDIVRGVVDAHAEQIRAGLQAYERHRSPQARLLAFVRGVAATGPMVAEHGCPHGTLCSELGQRGDDLADGAAALMRMQVDWACEQFRLMGRKDARDLAVTLISTVQGASLLTNTFHDTSVLDGQVDHLRRWLKTLA